jgi:ABC-type dipeptide/oligopeptide/nickel transport system permease component
LILALYPMGILGKIMDREFGHLAVQPFVEAARARGLSPRLILRRHIVPNALIPLLSGWVTLLPILLTGSFIVEIMFSVPGLGALLLRSVLNRDLPMLQGVVIVASALTLALHLAVELAYPAIDPRIAGGKRD